MTKAIPLVLSVVVPLYNEEAALPSFHTSLLKVLETISVSYEILYCDDGSIDRTPRLLADLAAHHPELRILRLSRNFGKEMATTAGIRAARGEAVMMIDADGQHPVELVPQFVERWRAGSKVVVGVRTQNQQAGLIKRAGSTLFYKV